MSLRTSLSLFLLLAILAPIAIGAQVSWEPSQSLVKIVTQSHDQYRLLDRLSMPIVDVQDNYVKALATPEQLARVRAMGFPVEVLLKDYSKEFEERGYPPMGVPAQSGTQGWNFYHTYAQVRDSLQALALRHPTICRLESLGVSVQNRALWGIRISDNVAVRENEPRFRITGNIHGNEHIGCEVALYMAYMLADSYGVSSRITQVVNEHEIFILPMQNPDGATNNVRTNANNVDLNRDYGYMWLGWGNSPDVYSQPETRLVRQEEEAHEYALSLAYHSGAVYVCYLWGHTSLLTQDDGLLKQFAWGFHTHSGYDTINSHRWYQVSGVSHDAAYGTHGNLETIIEVWLQGGANNPPPESIEAVCLRNKEGVIYTLNKGRTGIQGTVTDIVSGSPIQALIRPYPLSRGRDWFLYSSKENGDFHRPVQARTYSLALSANGYRDTVISNVVVPDTVNPVTVNVQMTPGDNYAAFRLIAVQEADTTAHLSPSLTPWVLGVPDNKAFSLSYGGRIFLDMGQGTEVVDGTGPDLRAVEYPSANDTIEVAISNAWNGPWTVLGNGVGTSEYDLAGHGISIARYVRIRDLGHGNNANATAGYDLDALVALNHHVGVEEVPQPCALLLTSYPNPFRTNVIISIVEAGAQKLSRTTLAFYDVTGRRVRTLAPLAFHQYLWDGRDSQGRILPGGVYFYRLDAPGSVRTEKVVLIR
jgi:hypothetical protein